MAYFRTLPDLTFQCKKRSGYEISLQSARSNKTIFKDAGRVQSWGTIVVIGGYWHVKAVSSVIIVFTIQHNLPKRWKSHFLEDLNFKNFPGEQAPGPPPTLYPYPDFQDLSVFGGRVSRRFPDKWMEGWQGRNRRRRYVFC